VLRRPRLDPLAYEKLGRPLRFLASPRYGIEGPATGSTSSSTGEPRLRQGSAAHQRVPYRDYGHRAFNEDKPMRDSFVQSRLREMSSFQHAGMGIEALASIEHRRRGRGPDRAMQNAGNKDGRGKIARNPRSDDLVS